jgi:uncharacterized membrane protein HdeD (DUF308 family)
MRRWHHGTVFGIVLCVAGVVALVAAFVGTRRHPELSWRAGLGR